MYQTHFCQTHASRNIPPANSIGNPRRGATARRAEFENYDSVLAADSSICPIAHRCPASQHSPRLQAPFISLIHRQPVLHEHGMWLPPSSSLGQLGRQSSVHCHVLIPITHTWKYTSTGSASWPFRDKRRHYGQVRSFHRNSIDLRSLSDTLYLPLFCLV